MEVRPSGPALIIVDVQRDFCPGGLLAVKDGDKVIPTLNKVIEAFVRSRLPVFFTRDWHPPDHVSFKAQGGDWPPHCVKGTHGAEFHPGLRIPPGATIISKADRPGFEAYSAFQGTNLEGRLKALAVDEVYVGGLATDYCVKQSTLDALRAGFRVNVMKDCVMAIDAEPGDGARALRSISAEGARLMTAEAAIERITKT
jgi:nicotinamidase/pyrazinamidase